MATWPRLRTATNDDCEQIRNLVYAVLEEYGLKPDPESTDADLADIEQAYFASGGAFYVLESQHGSIIGAYGLYRMDDRTCELRKMYLHRNYRGKGLGKRLLEDALNQARERGFTKVVLETASVLKEAIALYQTYGFTPHKPDHLSARCDQAYLLELQ
ncbi:MAG: GNAT family N-acetyltransferase [Sedimentisphaerales bacterium]|nr:GNAT family N-acetyltransferase [Sedimentisphaerales bacterium]